MNPFQNLNSGGANNVSDAERLATLTKALAAGQITGRETTNLTTASGAPLKLESLEGTAKILSYSQQDIVLYNKLPKLTATNTVEEYLQVKDYGSNAGFVQEGELPETNDSTFIRRSQLIKYIGETRGVTHQMELVQTGGGINNVMQNQIEHASLTVLRTIDKATAYGDSKIIQEEFNGLYAQHLTGVANDLLDPYHNSDVVVDMGGKALTEAAIQDAGLAIIENHGYPSLLMAPPKVLTEFVKPYTQYKHIQMGGGQAGVSGAVAGQEISSVQTQFGKMELGYDKFLSSEFKKKVITGATPSHAKAPATPLSGVGAAALVDDANQNWTGFTGDYFYAVVAINRFGQSAPKALTEGNLLTVTAGKSVTLTFTAGGGAYPPTGYVIYRSKANPTTSEANTTYYPLFKISADQLATGYDGGVATKVNDKNRYLPDTESCFLIEPTINVWSMKHLGSSLMKMDLAIVAPVKRFSIFSYASPFLYAPKKMVKFINVGTDA